MGKILQFTKAPKATYIDGYTNEQIASMAMAEIEDDPGLLQLLTEDELAELELMIKIDLIALKCIQEKIVL